MPITVPLDAPSEVRVRFKGNGQINKGIWTFQNTSQIIPVEAMHLSILIQTDRTIYSPGQKSIKGYLFISLLIYLFFIDV